MYVKKYWNHVPTTYFKVIEIDGVFFFVNCHVLNAYAMAYQKKVIKIFEQAIRGQAIDRFNVDRLI